MSGAEALELHTNNLDEVVGLMADHITGGAIETCTDWQQLFPSALNHCILRCSDCPRSKAFAKEFSKLLCRIGSHGLVVASTHACIAQSRRSPSVVCKVSAIGFFN